MEIISLDLLLLPTEVIFFRPFPRIYSLAFHPRSTLSAGDWFAGTADRK